MLLADKIIEYTREGKSPGVSELIELKEIARKEGVSQKDLDNRIQLRIIEAKNALDNKTEPQKTQPSSFERESFEEELLKRSEKDNTDFQFNSYSPENTFSSYSEVKETAENNEFIENETDEINPLIENLEKDEVQIEKIESVNVKHNAFQEISSNLNKVETESNNFEESPQIENVVTGVEPNKKIQETQEKNLNIEDLIQSVKERKGEEVVKQKETINTQKSDFLLEKEREWQMLHGKKQKKNSSNKTNTSPFSKNKTRANKEKEVQKAFNIALIAVFVSIIFGFIGIFVGMFAFQKQEQIKKVFTNKKLSKARTLSIIAMVIGVLQFVFSIFLKNLLGYY